MSCMVTVHFRCIGTDRDGSPWLEGVMSWGPTAGRFTSRRCCADTSIDQAASPPIAGAQVIVAFAADIERNRCAPRFLFDHSHMTTAAARPHRRAMGQNERIPAS